MVPVNYAKLDCKSCKKTSEILLPRHNHLKAGDTLEFKDYRCPECSVLSSGVFTIEPDKREISFCFYLENPVNLTEED